ncbi:hypothetical protein EJ08DRAFT_273128 [Tothia fuscella]|uniref:Uncharacterized protein n=1 Tax=Tothia fuscella TaxID=1048955 RepID=A0A9P4NPW6_9PEZI|nr:hypothetical protein EJ08DRAFT_273128 [Tothia fuscella]
MKVAWDHRRNVKAELREQCREYIEEIRQHEEEMKPCGGDMERHATMMSKYEGEIMELEETKQRHLKKIKDHEEEIQKLKEAKARSQKQMAEVDQELRSVLGRTNQEWEKYFRGLREQDQGYGERQ